MMIIKQSLLIPKGGLLIPMMGVMGHKTGGCGQVRRYSYKNQMDKLGVTPTKSVVLPRKNSVLLHFLLFCLVFLQFLEAPAWEAPPDS